MFQPESLRTDEYQPWSRGRGNDVWGMLHGAAEGDLEAIRKLVDRDPSLVDCEYHYYRPLHFAVRENRTEIVRFLLERGADPMCGGLGFRPVYKPGSPGNHPWPPDTAKERGFVEVSAILESMLRERFRIGPEGEELAAVIRDRNLQALRATLDVRPELIDRADSFGNRPIHWAVMTRQIPAIDLLLERGADINAMRPDGARPLDLTNGDYWYRGWRDVPREVLRQHEVLIGYLLARGAFYDISTAAQIGDLERVKALLDENPALVNEVPTSTGYYNGAPLRCAAGGGHLEIVKLLLERGADPNLAEPVTPHGGALYDAIAGKHWEIVKLLLAHGANPNAMVESSGNCFWRAKRDDAPREILDLMAGCGGAMGPEMACYSGELETIAAMLQANPNLPVHEHLDVDNEPLVGLVLRYQPDVLRKKRFEGAGSIQRARWLLEQGMNTAQPNWLGITPLHEFALRGRRDMAELCLEFGAQLDAIDDEYSSTPLGWAARAGQQDTVQWLLDRGADSAAPRDKPWATPGQWARRRGHDSIVTLLDSSRP